MLHTRNLNANRGWVGGGRVVGVLRLARVLRVTLLGCLVNWLFGWMDAWTDGWMDEHAAAI